MTSLTQLEGQLLIAMPGMGDPRFDGAVVFLCSHDVEGAMGLIVNKASKQLRFAELLRQLEIPADDPPADLMVHYGGPVESGRGFVLHSGDYVSNESTQRVTDKIGMTATLDILEDIGRGQGPNQALLALGYSGWGPGQLEAEIMSNVWLTAAPSDDLIFGLPNDEKWTAALASLGIDPATLSATSGRA